MSQRQKILHVTTSVGPGGAENMMLNLVKQHDQKGRFESVIVTTNDTHPGSLREKLEQHARVIDLQLNTVLSPGFIKAFDRVIQQEQPQLIKVWEMDCGVVAGAVSKAMRQIPVVWGIHVMGIPDHPSFGAIGQAVRRRIIGLGSWFCNDRIASCSHRSMTRLDQEFGFPGGRMEWLPNGIDVSRFIPSEERRTTLREELGIPANATVIGLVARRNPVKNLPLFFDSVSEMMQRNKDVHFLWSGGMPEDAEDEIAEAYRRLPDPDRMHLAGFRSQSENVYPALDICTLTSESEAFPMVLLEALACGVLGVSTDVGDAGLIIDECGGVAASHQPAAIVEQWEKLLRLPETEWNRLQQKGVQRIREDFSIERSAERYAELFQSLIRSR